MKMASLGQNSFSKCFLTLILLSFTFFESKSFVLGKHVSMTTVKNIAAGLQKDSKWPGAFLSTKKFRVEPLSFFVKKTRSKFAPYQIDFRVFDQNFNLTLQKPESTIFSHGFSFQGKPVNGSLLRDIEKNIFVDPHKMAVLRLNDQNGVYELEGYVNGMGIRSGNFGHFASRPQTNFKKTCHSAPPAPTRNVTFGAKASVASGLPLQNGNKNPALRIKRKSGIIEVKMLFDQALGDLLGETKERLITYASIMVKASNLIFDSLSDPSMTLRLVDVYMLSRDEDTKVVQDTEALIRPMLRELREIKSLYKGRSAVVPLLTGVETTDLEQDGTISYGTLGAAAARNGDPGACQEDLKLSVNRDQGGVWAGVKTMTHQIGHALNADDDYATECSDYFVMGFYDEGKRDSFKFSKCSQESIREFLETKDANCMFDKALDDIGSANELPGQRADLNDQCSVFSENNGCRHVDSKVTRVKSCSAYTCPVEKGSSCLDYEGAAIDEEPRRLVYKSILDGTPCTLPKGSDDDGDGDDDDDKGTGICLRGKCGTMTGES